MRRTDAIGNLIVPSYAAAVAATPNLAHRWLMGNAASPAVDDIGGADAPAVGAPLFNQNGMIVGAADRAVSFTGLDADRLKPPDAPTAAAGTEATWEFVSRYTGPTNLVPTVCVRGDWGPGWNWMLQLNLTTADPPADRGMQFWLTTTAGADYQYAATGLGDADTAAFHWAMRVNLAENPNMQIYRDGRLVAIRHHANLTAQGFLTSAGVQIAEMGFNSRLAGRAWQGPIQHFAIYTRALTPAEILDHAQLARHASTDGIGQLAAA